MSDVPTEYGPHADALIAAIGGDDGQMRAALDQLDSTALLRLATSAETVAAACRARLRSPRTSAAESSTMTMLDVAPTDIHPASQDPSRRWFRVQTPSRVPDHHYLALDPEGDIPRSLIERMRLYATMTDPATSGHAWFTETTLDDRETSLAPYLTMLHAIGFVEAQHPAQTSRSRRQGAPPPTETTEG